MGGGRLVPFDPKTAKPIESAFDPSTAKLFEPEEPQFKPYSPTISQESIQPIDVRPDATDVEKIIRENERPTRGVKDVLKDTLKKPTLLLPFIGSAVEAKNLKDIYDTAKLVQAGKTVEEERLTTLTDFIKENEKYGDSTVLANVADILVNLPAFAGEIYASGGITTIAKQSIKSGLKAMLSQGLKDKLQSKIAEKSLAKYIKKGTEASVKGVIASETSSRISRGKFERLLGGLELSPNETIIFGTEFDDEGDALKQARLDTYVEYMSEMTGGIFKGLKSFVGNKLLTDTGKERLIKAGFIKAFMKANKNANVKDLQKTLQKFGYHGILEEMFEERVGEFARGIAFKADDLGIVEGLNDPNFEYRAPTLEQLATELIAFSVPGSAVGAYTAYDDAKFNKSKVGKEILKAKESGEFDEVTIDVAENFARQNPKAFEERSLLNFIEETRIITREQKRDEGLSEEEIDEFFVGEGLDAETEGAGVLGSTLEENGQVLINLYKGARPDTVIEEFYGNAYRNLSEEQKSVFSQFYEESGSNLTEQEFFEKEGVKHYINEKLYENTTVQKVYRKLKQFFNEKILGNTTLDPKIRKMWEDAGYAKVGEGTTSKDESFQFENFKEELFETSKKVFGTTTNPKEAGYILPDGSMLDFSGKSEGGTPGIRAYDHRNITRLIDEEDGGSEKWNDIGMDEFINAGAIRFIPESSAFHMTTKPDYDQLVKMRELVDSFDGEVIIEASTPGVTISKSQGVGLYREYDKGTSWETIKRDVLQFYNTGRTPSILQQFHESFQLTVEDVAKQVKERKVRSGSEVKYGTIKGYKEIIETLSDPEFDMEGSFDWYRGKVKQSKDIASLEVPEIKDDPEVERLFEIILGMTSLGTKISPNYNSSIPVLQYYLENGKFNIVKNAKGNNLIETENADGKTVRLRRPAIAEMAIKLDNLIKKMGRKEALEWIFSPHPAKEVKEMNDGKGAHITGVADPSKQYYGASIFGPKIGRYIMNLHGVHEEAVFDLWWTRTWHRWMGTPFHTSGMNKGKLKEAPQGNPEIAKMDAVINNLVTDLTESTGYEWAPDQVQAVLWYYEKELYKRLGSPQEKGLNYTDVAIERAKKKGYYEQFTTSQDTEVAGDSQGVGSSVKGEPTQDIESSEEKISRTGSRDRKADTQEVTPSDESFQIQAFHGSPYKFDQFDSSQIGTGEGNQAFGHGLYFSSKKDIAEHYAKNVNYEEDIDRIKSLSDSDAKRLYEKHNIGALLEKGDSDEKTFAKIVGQKDKDAPTHKELLEWVVDFKVDEVDALRGDLGRTSNLYNVTLHKGKDPSEYDYMSWVLNVTPEQIKKIKSHWSKEKKKIKDSLTVSDINTLLNQKISDDFLEEIISGERGLRGRELYLGLSGAFRSDQKASKFLLDAGIDGIRYPAQGGTGGRFGDSENYVVFDDRAVTIDKQESFQLSPQQQEYFKDTKVVHYSGNPKVMYHSTDTDFTEFAKGDIGFHFGTAKASEDVFTRKSMIVGSNEIRQNWRTIPVYLDIKNPLRMRDIGKWDNAFAVYKELIVKHKDDLGSTKLPNPNSVPYEKRFEVMRNHLESLGYDGIVYGNLYEGSELDDSYIAFNPEQIKSVWNTDPASTGESFQLDALTDMTIPQRFERALIDKLNRLKMVQESVPDLQEDEDAIQVAETLHGTVSTQLEKFRKKIYDGKGSVLSRAKKDGFSLDDIGEYLYARHAKERNIAMQEKNPKLTTGSGMTDVEANTVLKKYRGTGIQKYALELYKEVTNKALKVRLDAGLIDKETYKNLKSKFKNYVPLKGLLEEDGYIHTSGKGFNTTSTGIMSAFGRESKAQNPLIQAIIDYESAVYKAENNKVGNAFLKMVQNNESPIWKATKRKFKPVYNEEGEVSYRPTDLKEDELQTYIDGERYVIKIRDKDLLRAMKNLNAIAQNGAMKFLNKFNAYYRAINTTINPEFIVTNFERDLQTALLNMTSEGKKNLKRNVVKDIGKAVSGIKSLLRKDGSHEWAKLYEEFKANGGKAGWMDFGTIEEKMADIEKDIKRTQNGNSTVKKVRDFIEDYNEIVENAVRLSTYKNLVDSGISKKKSAHYAKDLTVNFNRKGEWGTAMNTLWTFSNAGMQGSNRIWRALKGKNGKRVASSITAFGFLMSILNRYWDEDEWNQFDEYNKDNYFMILLPNKQAFSIKLPYGWNWFYSVGGAIEQTIFGDTTYGELIIRTAKNAVDAFAPISGGSVSQFISPTIIDPAIMLAENKNFFGGPIMKDKEYYGKTIKDHERGFKSVSPTLKEATKGIYDLSGVDISPETVEHIIESYSGGAGKFVANSVTTAIETGKGAFPDISKIPVYRQFFKGKSDWRSYNKAKDMLSIAEDKKLDGKLFRKYLSEALTSKSIDRKTYRRLMTQFNNAQRKVKRNKR